MGLRYRKSVKLPLGGRLNINKNSTSVSFGSKFHRTTINSKGKVTQTTRIPGTGLSYTTTSSGKQREATFSEASPKLYRFAGIFLQVAAVILFVLSLLLLLISPLALIATGLAVIFFLIGKKYRKIYKEKIEESQSEEKTE